MVTTAELTVLESRYAPAGTCAVCGNDVAEGRGVTVAYLGQVLRFKCQGCLSRFAAEPDRYLVGGPAGCCGKHAVPASPSVGSQD